MSPFPLLSRRRALLLVNEILKSETLNLIQGMVQNDIFKDIHCHAELVSASLLPFNAFTP